MPPARRSRKASFPGGGTALLRAKKAAQGLTNDNPDVQAGIKIVLKALEAPIRQIASNSGVEGSIVVGNILANASETYGFNAQTEEYVDMLQAGIVDPAKVVRAALQGAASIAGLLVTTEAMISELPRKEARPCRAAAAWVAWAAWTSKGRPSRRQDGPTRRRSRAGPSPRFDRGSPSPRRPRDRTNRGDAG